MKFFTYLSLTIGLLLPSASVFAAKITFEQPVSIVQVGDVITVLVLVDTENKTVNAFSGEIVHSNDTLQLETVLDGNSVINLWMESPQLGTDSVVFSGITPGGVNGSELELLALRFKAVKEGVGEVSLRQSELLLHDGLGTKENTLTAPLAFNILGERSVPAATTEYLDIESPEPFTPIIAEDPDVFSGAPFLIFATEDKGSGIAYYEVKEGSFSSYERATSPYKIKNPELKEGLSVRAVDRAGNEFVAEVYPQTTKPWQDAVTTKTAILIVCLLAFLILLRRILRKPLLH